MHGKRIGAYKTNEIVTADPKRLIVMCYDSAISNLKIAKKEYQDKRYEAKDKALRKARNIIGELLASLDFERGGQIAENLSMLYGYIIRRLTIGDIAQDLNAYDEAIGILEELGEAWKEILNAKNPQREQPIHSVATADYSSAIIA